MPLNIISYKKAIWKGIEGHLKGIVQKLEDSRIWDMLRTHSNDLREIYYESPIRLMNNKAMKFIESFFSGP